ncbi:MAG: FHA domain-containing protein [Bacteroidetes bacterium]|nr:FHA domain-containing protein [Bacteroidota bacterium]
MTKTFGRADNNNVRFNKPDISSFHTKVTLLADNKFFVEDLNSTNGTFVNGYRINKATISLKDELRLSESTVLNLAEIFGLRKEVTVSKADPLDFSTEFLYLKEVWEDYQKNRIAIMKTTQKRSAFIRSGITLAPLIIWEILQAAYIKHLPPEGKAFWQSKYIVFSVMGSTIAMLSTGNINSNEQLSQLDEAFRVMYVCPNTACRTQLGNVPWQSYYNQGKCFRCGAKYNNNH